MTFWTFRENSEISFWKLNGNISRTFLEHILLAGILSWIFFRKEIMLFITVFQALAQKHYLHTANRTFYFWNVLVGCSSNGF